jgi:hypothetical protein
VPCSSLPKDIATIFVPLEEQKLPHNICSAGELAVAPPLLASGMASMLNSTAKQAIQANASRCRDMGQSARLGDQVAVFSLIGGQK